MKGDTVESYIARVFPCEPPCDSYGICENCSEATLIRIGAELQAKQTDPAKLDWYEREIKRLREEVVRSGTNTK